ncbi:hypothetical protein QUA30_07785 [Microcoleus sp. Pol14C2]|uniref:hypothetical protein n=1 Tax=unclassified Microcoleus TaxID=2642155 RepID=UPI002FD191FB
MSIAPVPATPHAGWETSSRLTAAGGHTILDFRLAMAYYVKVWSSPTIASFFHTGGQNLVFLFYRPNYLNEQLKSPPAVR